MAANIIVVKDIGQKFIQGKIVFRITSSVKGENDETIISDKGMVTTFQDFERVLSEHEYISLIHLAPLTYKIAYLYGCLNFEKGKPRREIFTFWFRELYDQTWEEWFVVYPYKD